MKTTKRITTSFDDFEDKNNIEEVSKMEFDKLPDGYEIEEILDIIPPDKIDESWIGVPDISNKELKRGELIYITALVRKKGSTSFTSPSTQAVLKVRIVDIYHGLSYLNKAINR